MLRCATTNSMPCCCRRTCSYGLQVLLALEWDTNPTRDIEMRPHEGPSSPCARSAACLSFQCVAMRSAGSVLGAPGYFGLRFEWPLLTGFSTGHQFGRLFFLCWQTAAASMAEERKAVLSTAHVPKTRHRTLPRALRPMVVPTIYRTWGRSSSGSAGHVLFLPTFRFRDERRSSKTISADQAYLWESRGYL